MATTSFCGNSTFWDEARLVNNSYPEFTRCFQDTALTYAPCGWLWVTAPIHLIYLHKHTQFLKLGVTWISIARLLFAGILALLAGLHMLAPFDSMDDDEIYPPSFYLSQSVWAATFLLVFVLMILSQRSGVPSPCVIFIFWTLTFVSYIIPVYTLAMQEAYENYKTHFALVCTTFAVIATEFALQCLGDTNVQLLDSSSDAKPCPMIKASFVSRLTFSWVFNLVYSGYKKVVVLSDIFDVPNLMQCRYNVPEFMTVWLKELNSKRAKYNKFKKEPSYIYSNGTGNITNSLRKSIPANLVPTEKTQLLQADTEDEEKKRELPSLYKVLAKVYYLPLFKAQLVGLIGDLTVFINPLLLDLIIGYAENKEDYPEWHGYLLACSFFFIAFLNSMMNNYRFYHCTNIGMQVKTVLTAAVYKKSLTMNAEARRKFTVGTIVNLMAVDCPRFQELTFQLYVLISWPVQISIAFYMLYETLGIAFVAGIVVLLLLIPTNSRISTLARKAQAKQIFFKDQRIKLFNEILNGVKVLKLYAWEPSFSSKLQEYRNAEVKQLRKAAIYNSINVLIWALSPVLVTACTFIAFVLITENSLTPSKAFVAMNLFNTIRQPMNTLPMLISQMVLCHVSMERLRDYLSGEDLDEVNTTGTSEEIPLVMKNATFSWDRTMPPVLRNITVTIPKGKLVAVVGQVGSGKSSLLSAFLGEMEKLDGFNSITGTIGYVPQQAWIQNMTLRSNVLFDQPVQEKRYKKVIKACALEADLELLPGGELTEIGEKGINLSGGQKQRISLARAVYHNSDVYLLDDPLSAVDAHVGKHIFQQVIGPKGMLKNKTRILVTHGIHWLPEVDSIIVMDQGQVKESGSYKELMSHDGPFAQFVKTYLLEHEEDDCNDPEVQKLKEQMLEAVAAVTSDEEYSSVRLRRSLSDQSGRKQSNASSRTRRTNQSASEDDTTKLVKQARPEKHAGEQLIEEEKLEKGKVRLSIFLTLLKAFGYISAMIVPLSVIVYNGFNIGAGIYLSDWTEDPFLKNESNINTDEYTTKTYEYLGVYSALTLVQVLGNAVFIFIVYVQFVNASKRLHNSMLDAILHQPMAFFDTTPVGRILNRFSRDVDVLDSNLARQVRMVLQTLSQMLSIVIVITYTTPIFLALVVPILIIYVLFQKFYIPSSRQFRRLESTTRSPIFSHFSETINGASSIRAYRACDRFFLDSQNQVDVNNKCSFASGSAARWLRVRLEVLGSFIVLFAGLFAIISSDIVGGMVGLSLTYALQITIAMNLMVQNFTDLETNSVSVERIVEYTEFAPEPEWTSKGKQPAADWPRDGEIKFENYSTRYRPQLDLVLKKVSFTVNSGEKVGIVGRTGAGKSSLSLALFRLIEAAEGRILIDGLDISTIGLHDLRSKLTILPQDPVLFSGSLRFNLDPFDVHTDQSVWEALNNAHLGDFVKELPGQLNYITEEGGQNLSVGQRQLMCLARSLLRKTKILILDEATAAVDLETDFLLQNTIRKAFKDCTVLTVAHRLKTVIDYDRILVLSDGEIKEFGTPADLLSNKQGIFYSMAKESNLVQ
ncbi:multidrug resistance-associated protein 1-like isoform X2 [Physella acuta]|uniref:multidrug resistance-associated protein 1-like isoform X2 n=1 Tax=Physella acuta TaxID=109671 RepID=UPI0027DDCF34|nr:multidrug resistance-associated protein 1-like isoform X2 [Physella acuta]